jgi:hypothetical protein
VFKFMPEKAANRDDVVTGRITSEGDAFLNGALPCLIDGAEGVFKPEEYYQNTSGGPWSPQRRRSRRRRSLQTGDVFFFSFSLFFY